MTSKEQNVPKHSPLRTRSGRAVKLTEKSMAEFCRKLERNLWRALFNLERSGKRLEKEIEICHDPTQFKNHLVTWMESYSLVKSDEHEVHKYLPTERLVKIMPEIERIQTVCVDIKKRAFQHLESLTLDMQKELESSGSASSFKGSRSFRSGRSKVTSSTRKAGRSPKKASSSTKEVKLTKQMNTLMESIQTLKNDIVNLTQQVRKNEQSNSDNGTIVDEDQRPSGDTSSRTSVRPKQRKLKPDPILSDRQEKTHGSSEKGAYSSSPARLASKISVSKTMSELPPIRRSTFHLPPADNNLYAVNYENEVRKESTPMKARRVRIHAEHVEQSPPSQQERNIFDSPPGVRRSVYSPKRYVSRTAPPDAQQSFIGQGKSHRYDPPPTLRPKPMFQSSLDMPFVFAPAAASTGQDQHCGTSQGYEEDEDVCVDDIVAVCPQLTEDEIREDMLVWQRLQEKYSVAQKQQKEPSMHYPQKDMDVRPKHSMPPPPYKNSFNTSVKTSADSDKNDGRSRTSVTPSVNLSSTSADSNLVLANAVEHLAKAAEVMFKKDKIAEEERDKPKLPNLEPAVFQGDTLGFHVWLNSFKTLVESRVTDPLRKLCYLEKYTDGPAKVAIKELLDLTDDITAFDKAISKLKERYGSPMIVAAAFRKKIKNWPMIKENDSQALTQYSDFLSHCNTAMQSIGFLRILAEPEENKKLAEKLPEKVADNWNRLVVRDMYPDSESESEPKYPSFKDFCAFLRKEARVAAGPCAPKTIKSSEKKKVTLLSNSNEEKTSKIKKTKIKKNDNKKDKDSQPAETDSKSVLATGKRLPACLYCTDEHWINKCPKFLDLTPASRRAYCVKTVVCFGCLRKGHDYQTCKFQCNYLLMEVPDGFAKTVNIATGSSSNDGGKSDHSEVRSNVAHSIRSFSSDLTNHYTTVVPVRLAHMNKPDHHIVVYALLDTQSDGCFVDENVLKSLGVGGYPVDLRIKTISGEGYSDKSSCVQGLTAQGLSRQAVVHLPECYSRPSIPANRDSFARVEVIKDWPHLEDVIPHLHPYDKNLPVGLLLGYNCVESAFPGETRKVDASVPWAQDTVFGWTVCGPSRSDSLCTGDFGVTCFSASTSIDSFASLRAAFDLDFGGPDSEKKMSYEDTLFLRRMEEGFRFDGDGHVVLPLPVREGVRVPPGYRSRNMAYKRFKSQERKFRSDEKLLNAYISFFAVMFSEKHAEEAPLLEPDELFVFYLPHQIVYHPRKPDKPRVVYDGSATVDGISLNDLLMQGPDLANSLLGVLLRFREGRIAFQCDLMKMFHQVRVSEEWRNLLRFFWYKDNDPTKPVIEYRVTVHLFGASSSPSVATFALRKIADTYESQFGADIASFIRRYFYVDDGLKSVEAVEKALEILNGSKELCAKGGFKLHEIASNNIEVLDALPRDSLCKALQAWNPDLPLPVLTALGVHWHTQSDTLIYVIKAITFELSRRGLLSAVGSIYDPIGLISPVMLKGRLILQDLCHEKLSWDAIIDESMQERWNEWYLGLKVLETLRIPRCYLKNVLDVESSELHCFGDASGQGYGGCIYLVLEDDENHRDVSLVLGKSRVKPSKRTTTPRLELQAAVLVTRMAEFVKEELPQYPNMTVYYWSDSMIIIAYITNTGTKYKIYVANRVQAIRDKTNPDQWGHMSSEDNPADIASRGCNAEDIVSSDLWFQGPSWLQHKIVRNQLDLTVPLDDPEVLHDKVVLDTTVRCEKTQLSILESLNKLPSWLRMIQAVQVWRAAMRKWFQRAKDKRGKIKRDLPQRSPVEDRHISKMKIIQLLQKEAFPVEYNESSPGYPTGNKQCRDHIKKITSESKNLRKLDVYLCEKDMVLKVGGRLRRADLPVDQVHPVVLPRQSETTNKLIRYYHEAAAHAGRYSTVHLLHYQGWWITGIRSAVDFVIKHCVTCKRLRGKPEGQKMADLPNDRLETLPPFTYCCVDFFGLFYVKEKRSILKRWACLFSCLLVRAVHIEVCTDMTTDSFIRAYRRFNNRRGPIRSIRCDRGSNLMGSRGELDLACSNLDESTIRRHLLQDDCDWVTFVPNPPKASHMGGVWERMIGSTRRCLEGLLVKYGHQLTDDSLRTVMTEAEGIINNRPLTYVELSSPTEPQSITPAMLLTMKFKKVLAPFSEEKTVEEDKYAKEQWKRVQLVASRFWDKWKVDYLSVLTARNKWHKAHPNLRVDDIVLLVDQNISRSSWPMARIVSVKESDDGLVRTIMVRTKDGIYCRPVHKVVLLYRKLG